VAITGLGLVAPLGNSVDELCANLVAGRSGIRLLDIPQRDGLRSPIGASADFRGDAHFAAPRIRMLDRVSQMALVAAAQAVADANLKFGTENRDRCGVSVGSGMGGAESTDEGYYIIYA